MEEAPRLKPLMTGRTPVCKAIASDPIIFVYIINKLESPIIPRPTTLIPITEPPVKATFSASERLFRAAFVVLTLAAVATRIPIYPARADEIAPIIKDKATKRLLPLLPRKRSIATASTNQAKTLYSLDRKAMAPSCMFLAMVVIVSFPASSLLIQRVLYAA